MLYNSGHNVIPIRERSRVVIYPGVEIRDKSWYHVITSTAWNRESFSSLGKLQTVNGIPYSIYMFSPGRNEFVTQRLYKHTFYHVVIVREIMKEEDIYHTGITGKEHLIQAMEFIGQKEAIRKIKTEESDG